MDLYVIIRCSPSPVMLVLCADWRSFVGLKLCESKQFKQKTEAKYTYISAKRLLVCVQADECKCFIFKLN